MPKAVPLISPGVYWAKSVLFMGWRKKLKKKKRRDKMRSKRSVVKDMAKMNGKARMEMARNFFSKWGLWDKTPPPYCPKTPIERTMADNIPPRATLSREKIWNEVRFAM